MNLIQYLILSTACLSFSYIAFRLSFEKETRFRQQRLFLVASLTISLLLPLTGFRIDYEDLWGKREETALQIQQLSTVSVQTPVINTGNGNFKIHTDLIVKIYLIITLIFFIYAAIQFIRIVRLYSISKKADRDIGVVLYNENIKSPFSFFRWIFIPKEICDRDERESIILHESIHVSQYHSFDNLLIELVAAVMWFNPLVWMMKKSLHLVHEYLADEGTLNTGIDRLKYQALLLNQVTEERLICLSSSFNNSLIKKRMIMMTKSKNENQNRFKILTLLPLTLFMFLMVAMLNGLFPQEAKAVITDLNTLNLQTPEPPTEFVPQQDTAKNKNAIRIRVADNDKKSGTNEIKVVGYAKPPESLIFIVDGVKVDDIKGIDPETIESVNVLKEDNLIVIRTKKPVIRQTDITGSDNKKSTLPDNVLYIIDGITVDKSQFEKTKPVDIDVIQVIKDKEVIKKYSDFDYEGVIIVTTKVKL